MLADRIIEVLEKDAQDEIVLLRLEVAYAQSTGRGLKEDLAKNGQNYGELFAHGLPGSSGVIYTLGTNNRGQQVVRRISPPLIPPGYGAVSSAFNDYPASSAINMNPFNTTFLPPGAKFAKIAEIYDECNKELEKDQFGEMPLELLEERVIDNLFTRDIVLTEAQKGQNFMNLVQRASGNYIRGSVRDGKLCRAPNTPVQTGNLTDEPPPPYRPPSSFPQGKESLELLDSDEECDININDTQQAPPLPQKYSRFSGPNINNRNEKEFYRPQSSLKDGKKPMNETIKDSLIRKYLVNRAVHVIGNEEETATQMKAMQQCINLWEDKIENFSEFLYILKCFWLQYRTISVFDIDSKMFDNVVDSSGIFSLEWNVFGITEDDLAPLNLFVRASKASCEANEGKPKLNQIEINPFIQQADFLLFNSGTSSYRVYHILLKSKREEESLQYLAQYEQTSVPELIDQLNKWPEIFRIDKTNYMVQLNRPFPFFIIGDFS